jgi:cobalamin synthase
VSRRFLRDVATAAVSGQDVTVTEALAKSYGANDGGSLGGAIVAAAASRSVPVLGARSVRHGEAGLGGWWRDSVRSIDVVVCLATVGLIALATRNFVHVAAAAAGLVAGMAILLLLERRFEIVTGDSHGAAIEGAFLVALIVEVAA